MPRLPRPMIRRMIRRGEYARALHHAGVRPPIGILSSLGLHLSVLDRAGEARRISDRCALAVALAVVGDASAAKAEASEIRHNMSPGERRRFAAAVAMWSPQTALDWLPSDQRAARAACFVAAGDVAAAQAECVSLAPSREPRQDREIQALRALLLGRQGDPAGARAALNELFRIQGWRGVPDALPGGDWRPARQPDWTGEPPQRSAPLVSVLMPARNAANTIAAAIGSILAQSCTSLELIVVDDASLDGTSNAVTAAFAGDPRCRLVRVQGSAVGPAAARNRALALATGRYVAMQDADDWSHPERIATAVATLESKGALALVSDLLRIGEDGVVVAPRVFPLIRLNPSSLIFARLPVVNALGVFDPAPTGSDMEYIARIVSRFGHKALLRDRNVSMLVALRTGSLTFRSHSAIDSPDAIRRRIAYREQWLRRQCDGLRASHRGSPVAAAMSRSHLERFVSARLGGALARGFRRLAN